MEDKNTDSPQYRKLSNGRCFYEILDDRNFREIQLIGTKVAWYSHCAEKYPEMLRIMDMLEAKEPYIISDKQEFESVKDSKN